MGFLLEMKMTDLEKLEDSYDAIEGAIDVLNNVAYDMVTEIISEIDRVSFIVALCNTPTFLVFK